MDSQISFLDKFTNAFNKGEDDFRYVNRRKICGLNNLLYSFGDPSAIQGEHLEAEHVHIYGHNRGYFEPETEFLRKAFDLLRIKYEYHEVNYPSIGFGELPLLRIEYMIFTKQYFVDVVLQILSDGTDLHEETTNLGVISLFKELSKVTNHYMWSSWAISYKYRNRKWLLFQPISRTQELTGNWKKRIGLAQQGIDSDLFAFERAKELLEKLERIGVKYNGFYLGNRQANPQKAQLIDLIAYCYLEEITRNTLQSELYELLIEKHSLLKKFTEDFARNFHKELEGRQVGASVRIRYRKPDLTHSYESRYKTAEDIKKQNMNSIFLSITSISLLLYVYLYHKN